MNSIDRYRLISNFVLSVEKIMTCNSVFKTPPDDSCLIEIVNNELIVTMYLFKFT